MVIVQRTEVNPPCACVIVCVSVCLLSNGAHSSGFIGSINTNSRVVFSSSDFRVIESVPGIKLQTLSQQVLWIRCRLAIIYISSIQS